MKDVSANLRPTRRIDRRSAGVAPVTGADVYEAALTAFADRGYFGTSLKDIANAVGLQAPSLYNHISSKADLLSEIVLDTLSTVFADFEAAVAAHDNPVDQLREATYVYALHHATHRRETMVVNQDARHLEGKSLEQAQDMRRTHERDFRRLIADGIKDGYFQHPSPKLASFAIREMCVSVARWFHDQGDLKPEDVARTYASQALRVVGVTP
ncbi:TetR family transcriptional regulator [Nocardioides sp. NPDC047086]|uniref:TetR family transcriptional regulator n=1 Tax=Nocardioides sp. NPDC047086 TaxID=3154810 RepID=UPI0033C253DF